MLNQAETREAILRWIARPQYVPAKIAVVAQQLGILKEDFKEFQRLVRNMRKDGLLRFGAGHVIWPVLDAELDNRRIVGYFHRHPDGYGFVREAQLTPNAENIAEIEEDVFIPPGKTLDASTGDFVSVLVDEHAQRSRGKERGRSGVIEKILERKTRTFVGTYSENRDGCWVEADGRIFAAPIRIPDTAGAQVRDGDKVVIEILNFPTSWRAGEGVITEVLGPRGDLKTDTLAVMRQYNLKDKFSEEVLAETRLVTEIFEKWEEENIEAEAEYLRDGRKNLVNLFTITIDPADARDFDDAISIETLENGDFRLAVHIADVSSFVAPDSRLDREAFDRGNSVYLPDHVIPMLPEMLCNGIASLQPNRIRWAKTVFITISPTGVWHDVELCDSVIRSDARLNYEQVDRFFAGERSELPERVQKALEKFRTLAKILRERRKEQGKLEMNLPEIRLELDRDGRVTGVRREVNTESHQMIEEFMVCTNEAVAQELVACGSNLMRRIHKAPSEMKLDGLNLFLEEIGIYMKQKADRFELQRILEQTAGTKNEFAVHQAVLRAMTRAEYSPEEEGHYALASECYCHFTSPIRRYADLTIHRQIEQYILGASPKRNFRKIYDEGKHLTYCENNAEEAERELTRIKMIHFFSEKGDVVLDARIVGVTHHGFFVECVQYPISGLVSVDSLPEDRYRYDARTQTLNGFHLGNCFRLGDKVTVQIADIDKNRREISFELARKDRKRRATDTKLDDEQDWENEEFSPKELKKFPSWDELSEAETNPSVPVRLSAALRGMETIHVRATSKKAKQARKAEREKEQREKESRNPKTGKKSGSSGNHGGKKMTRKCKNCAPKGKRK